MYSTVQGPKPLMASSRSRTSAGIAVEPQSARRDLGRHLLQRPRAGGGQADRAQIEGGNLLRGRKGALESGLPQRAWKLVAQCRNQPTRQRARAGYRDLLPQDRAHRGLEAVPGARDPHAGETPSVRPELRRCRQRLRDPIGVRVEVEEPPDSAGDRLLCLRAGRLRLIRADLHFGQGTPSEADPQHRGTCAGLVDRGRKRPTPGRSSAGRAVAPGRRPRHPAAPGRRRSPAGRGYRTDGGRPPSKEQTRSDMRCESIVAGRSPPAR